MSYKVLLNCFPPTTLEMPAIGCEVLKTYISEKNKIYTEVVYWNHLFQDLYQDPETKNNLFQPKDDLHKILPFLSILAENSSNQKIKERIIFAMQEEVPSLKVLGANYYQKKYEILINRTLKIIHNQLDILLSNDVILFGISAKFDAWIPGIVVTQELKKRRPDIHCIIGGIEEVNAASVLFQKYEVFDFAIWGEGEIPLSLLLDKLIKKETDFDSIPRLLHRKDKLSEVVKKTKTIKSKDSYYNIQEYFNHNFKDYFKYAQTTRKEEIQIPIEISRGCRWNNCNFCALNLGYTYRVQDFSNVINQIKNIYLNYKVKDFFFVDNDIVGKNMNHFEIFLDELINLSTELGIDFDFHADILHLGFNKKIIKKLSLAGFKSVQIGYEAITDSMLKKLNKSTSFAENLLFIKFAQKYDIKVTISGLIIGLPDETEEDIFESTNNLHFLRLFLGEKKEKLQHCFSELILFYNTRFWNMFSEKEKEKFSSHPLNDYLPDDLINNIYIKFSLLGQFGIPLLKNKWNSFMSISDYYQKSIYKYYLIENDGLINYMEYKDDLKIESLVFDKPEYWDVLKIANDEIISFSKMHHKINEKYDSISKEYLGEIIQDLKKSYLLYSSDNNTKIISIIDTELLS
jgi:radical SAM superfamily enzyme YgiQ (UPF0313 family)